MEPEHPRPRLRTSSLIAFALIVGGAIAWGPLLPWTVSRIAAAPTRAGSPGRLYFCAKAQRALGRHVQARETLELWLDLYAREEGRDWGPLLSGESEYVCSIYDMKDGLPEQGFAPWTRPGQRKRGPVAPVSDAFLGRVLLDYVELLLAEREYPQAAHVVVCLLNLWPKDGPVHEEALPYVYPLLSGGTRSF